MRLITRGFAAILFCILLVGCTAKPNQGTVSGTVTLDGQPLKKGNITFKPADGRTATAGESVIDGKYTVAMPPGEKQIQISAGKVVGQKKTYENMPDSPVYDVTEEILPARYNTQSELKMTVTTGSQSQDFKLKSK